jgi:hypothetical protein
MNRSWVLSCRQVQWARSFSYDLNRKPFLSSFNILSTNIGKNDRIKLIEGEYNIVRIMQLRSVVFTFLVNLNVLSYSYGSMTNSVLFPKARGLMGFAQGPDARARNRLRNNVQTLVTEGVASS